jgi:cytosine/adenosine deaminase-related metal-dependent hydrolase
MSANLIQEMAIKNNRDLVENQFNGLKVGAIKEGYKADIILVDYDPFTELTKDNFPWHIVFGFRDGMVTTTIVDGKILMRDRTITILDEKTITAEAHKLHKAVWKRYHKYFV